MSADNCVQCDKGCSEVRVIDDKDIDNEKSPLLNNPAPNAKRRSDLGDLETLMHLLKASLGTGILAMPMAFKNAGLLFGLFGTFFIGYICTYCVHMFVKCAQILCQKRQLESIGFRKIVELAFLEGPPRLRKYSKIAGVVIITAILMELLGCCCAYVVFVAKSVKQVVDHYGGHDLDVRLYMLALLPCLIVINLLRKLKYITPFSVISNSLFIGGVFISYYYIFDNLPSIKDRPFFSSWQHLPKFFGTTIFALEGIGVMMPLENSMKTPKHFIGCPGVLNTGMIILVALYSITGFFGYLKYGSNTEDSITFNIPTGELLGQSLKIVIAIGIFLTYSLLFYASMDLFRDSFAEQFRGNNLHVENLFRIFIITATVAVAAIFPNLSPFLTLVGALSLSTVGLIFPPIIEMLVYWQSPGFGLYWWRLWKNLFIVLFGFLGLVTGTMTSIAEFAQTYKHPDK